MTDRLAVVLVDKEPGPSSHYVVAEARRALGLRRVGHTGTLDPFAGGLLILCVGRATRLVEYFHLLPKSYEAEIVFGEARDTDDRTGRVTERLPPPPELDDARIEAALAASLGRSDQRPPDYSARRVDGDRAYEAARRGRPLALEARPVEVYRAELLGWTAPVARVRYSVSTGTYVRALARDLGEALGCPAHLGALRRTRIGPFAASDAGPASEIAWDGTGTSTPLAALAWLPSRELTGPERTRIGHGQAIGGEGVRPPRTAVAGLDPGELPVVLHADDELVAVARRIDCELRPEKVFDVS
ncbi:MAG: tRNA pseudouridine(55) synthase TruB [Gemmatimonadota bacterium]